MKSECVDIDRRSQSDFTHDRRVSLALESTRCTPHYNTHNSPPTMSILLGGSPVDGQGGDGAGSARGRDRDGDR